MSAVEARLLEAQEAERTFVDAVAGRRPGVVAVIWQSGLEDRRLRSGQQGARVVPNENCRN
jgi:hypothetical protein